MVANLNLPTDVILRQSTKLTDSIPYVYNTENEFAGSKKASRGDEQKFKPNRSNWKKHGVHFFLFFILTRIFFFYLSF